MSSVLKGNFTTGKTVSAPKEEQVQSKDLESMFENEAMKRLGGSIAFVSKKKVAWEIKE